LRSRLHCPVKALNHEERRRILLGERPWVQLPHWRRQRAPGAIFL